MSLPDSRHFTLEQLANGVWAVIHRHGGWAVGNAGIVDLGDRTLIFDTLLTPAAARDLRSAAEALTGRPTAVVVNSHYHNDHVRGNQVFPEALLASTRATRSALETDGREELAYEQDHARERLEASRAQAAGSDPGARAQGSFFLPYWEGLVAALPEVTLRFPELTVDGPLRFEGSERRAELLPLAGHTVDDAVLFVPDAGVVFCADLLFVRNHPFLADGDPAAWLESLDALEALGASRLVPGHGPVGAAPDLAIMRDYIGTLEALAGTLVAQGTPPEEVGAEVPDRFRGWELERPFFAINLRFLAERLARDAS